MAEGRGRLGFALEPLDHAFALHDVRQHRLDGDLAIQGEVETQVHGCHSTATQLAVDVVLTQGRCAQQLAKRIDVGVDFHGDRLPERLAVWTPDSGDVRAAIGAEVRSLIQRLLAPRAGEAGRRHAADLPHDTYGALIGKDCGQDMANLGVRSGQIVAWSALRGAGPATRKVP